MTKNIEYISHRHGWSIYRVDLPKTRLKPERWMEYALPDDEKERTSAHKAVLRKLERTAAIYGVTVQKLAAPRRFGP